MHGGSCEDRVEFQTAPGESDGDSAGAGTPPMWKAPTPDGFDHGQEHDGSPLLPRNHRYSDVPPESRPPAMVADQAGDRRGPKRSRSMDDSRQFLLKVFIPFPLLGNRKKPTSAARSRTEYSPRPSVDGAENDRWKRKHSTKCRHEDSGGVPGCWPAFRGGGTKPAREGRRSVYF